VEDARLRVAARRGGPRRESRPPWFLGKGPINEVSARQRAVHVDLASGGKARSAETCGTQGSVHEHPVTGAAGRAPVSC
jgi:hypothetical protein